MIRNAPLVPASRIAFAACLLVAAPLRADDPQQRAEQVTATASRTEQRVADTGAAVLVLDEAALASAPELALDEALRQVPGFTLFRRSGSLLANPTTQGISLRGVGGSGASRAVVLLDGIPLNDPFGGWVTWSAVPRLAVARAEILRGGASDVWGSPALTGAVGLVRRAGGDALLAEASGGSFGTDDATLAASRTFGAWSADIGVEAFKTDGVITVAPEQRGPVDTEVASNHRTLEASVARALPGGGKLFARGSALTEARENGRPLETNDTNRRQLAVGADLPAFGGNLELRAFALHETYHQSFTSVNADRTLAPLIRLQEVPAEAYGGSGKLVRVFGVHVVVAGFDAGTVRGRSDETPISAGVPSGSATAGGTQRAFGFWVEDLVAVGPRLRVTAALRFDLVNDTHGQTNGAPLADTTARALSPRLTLVYDLGGSFAATASVYRSFRAPTLNELYRSFRLGDTLTLANAALEPERLTGYEAGLLLRRAGPLEGRLTLYEMDLAEAVANVTVSTTPTLVTRQRRNLGGTRTRGAELDLKLTAAKGLDVTAGWLFADAVVSDSPADPTLQGKRVPQVPRHQVTLGARWRPLGLLLSAQLRWQTRVFEDDRNTAVLGSALLLDALVSREVLRGLSLFAAGENLLDRQIETGRSPVLTLAPGISLRGGVRLAL